MPNSTSSSKIKDVYIQLRKDYKFYHGAVDHNPFFLGRKKLIDRIKLLVEESASPSGAYLITGYRGMGKTSVVREALQELENNSEHYEKIEISLSQDEVTDFDILRPIARQLWEKWENIGKKQAINRSKFQTLNFDLLIIFGVSFGLYLLQHFFFPIGLVTWIILMIVILFLLLVLTLRLSTEHNRKDYKSIRKQLSNLNQRLDSKVSRESQSSLSNSVVLSPKSVSIQGEMRESETRKFQQSYEIATAKDIEYELTNILEKVYKFKKEVQVYEDKEKRKKLNWLIRSKMYFVRKVRRVPNFVIIIDELDKIEPNYIFNPEDGEATQKLLTADFNLFGGNKIKKRQIAVAKILANLKSFLNIAKAKFIFIGGREMYDAFLADIADRDSFYSSIFNDVIYVESFFKDKAASEGGLSLMTEHYLCQLLMEEESNDGLFNLSHYYEQLVKKYPIAINSSNTEIDESEIKENKLQVYKTIFLLQNFIIFLAYRSNGSPKKLAELVAEYIVREPDEKEKVKSVIIKNSDKKGLFLKFSYQAQYEIGLTSNLYRPYVIIHSRYLKSLEDKLLYSTAYIMDYILKFHQHAFSWRNLELIPDIILVNKDPNLRYFMEDIMRFFSYMHVRETISGIFQYKFYSKVTNEIKLLSKISDSSSAAFNFGLDESFQIKSYYKSKLKETQQSFKEYGYEASRSEFIHSISFIQSILGDLYYYDKEYDDAMVYYSDSIQAIRNIYDNKVITNHQAVLFVRNKLKLGLCLEKIRAFDSAYSIYRSLNLQIPYLIGQIKNEEEIGQRNLFSLNWEKPYIRMQLFIKPYVALLGLIEKQRNDGLTYANLRRNREELDRFLGSNAAEYLTHSKEDRSVNKITADSMEEHFAEEQSKAKKKRDWRRIQALNSDYFNSVGGFLFYKNRNFPWLYKCEKEGESKIFQEFPFDDILRFLEYMNKKKIPDYVPSLSAYVYYRWSLRELLKVFYDDENSVSFGNNIPVNEYIKALRLLKPKLSILVNSTNFYMLGNLFAKLGDCVLSIISNSSLGVLDKSVIDIYTREDSTSASDGVVREIEEWLEDRNKRLPDFFAEEETDSAENQTITPYDINLALVLYRIAGLFYMKGGRTYSYAFQYKKLLYVIKDYVAYANSDLEQIGAVKYLYANKEGAQGKIPVEIIAEKLFKAITWVANISNRPQIIKYREILQHSYINLEEVSFLDTKLIYNNISTSPETREVILLIEEIRLKLLNYLHGNDDSEKQKFFNQLGSPRPLLTSYDSVSNMFTRCLELKYKCEYNYYIVAIERELEELLMVNYRMFQKEQMSEKKLEQLSVDGKFDETVDFVIDSIYCLFDLIRILNLQGINYTTNFSYLANAHYKLANWCNAYWNLKHMSSINESIGKKPNDIKEQLRSTLGTDAYNYVEPNYHKELAIQHFYSAIQMHQEGKAYREHLNNMNFLEDDFNDNLTHFSAANERWRINLGYIRKRIKKLQAELGDSRVYQYPHYIKDDDTQEF